MNKSDIILNSLPEVFEGSSLDEIYNGGLITEKGARLKSFTVASCPMYNGTMLLYQITLMMNPEVDMKDRNILVFLNVQHLAPGKGRHADEVFCQKYSRETSLGEIRLIIPAKGWDLMREGILTGVFDYIDNHIESKVGV